MARIPTYLRLTASEIKDDTIILSENLSGNAVTVTIPYSELKKALGNTGQTGVISIITKDGQHLTGNVQILTGDIIEVTDFRFVTDDDLETLSRFVIDGENLKLYDADEHVITFVGRDGQHEIGIDMINPLRFDIQVPPTVPTGKSTFTLQEDRSDALSFISGNNRFIKFVTTLLSPIIEIWQKLSLKVVEDGDDTMQSLVLDPTTGEVKKATIEKELIETITYPNHGKVVNDTISKTDLYYELADNVLQLPATFMVVEVIDINTLKVSDIGTYTWTKQDLIEGDIYYQSIDGNATNIYQDDNTQQLFTALSINEIRLNIGEMFVEEINNIDIGIFDSTFDDTFN